MDTHWFDLTKKKVRQHAGTTVRILGSAVLFATVLAPMPAQQSTTEAGTLSWSDTRPLLTTNEDTSSSGGFDSLAAFGTGMHAITVADNGDIFAAGGGNIFRSTDDGASWSDWAIPIAAAAVAAVAGVDNSVPPDGDFDDVGDIAPVEAVDAVLGMGDATIVREIVTSPNYSSDGFVAFVFTSATAGQEATDNNGFCYSSDEGEEWDCYNGARATGPWDDTELMSLTLEPDFDGDGNIVFGGGGTTKVFRIDSNDLGAVDVNGDRVPVPTATLGTDSCTSDNPWVLDVSYNANERPEVLGRLIATDNGVYGQLYDDGWVNCTSDTELLDDDANSIIDATAGSIGFDSNYESNDVFFASVSGTADGNTGNGGVFIYDGDWEELTANERDCDGGYDSLTVAGEDGDTILVGSMSGSNIVCSSEDEGDDWDDTTLGGSSCTVCKLTGASDTRVALNRENPDNVYWTSAGMLSAVFSSSNTGGSFQETGLTNLAYVTGSPNERSTSMAFAMGTAPGGQDALFQTNNYGSNAEWQRVLRYDGSDLSLVSPSGDFATAATMYAFLTGVDKDPVLKSTNGGVSWDETSADPFDDSDEDNELIKTMSQRSANTLVAGGTKGTIAMTTDGGSTWTNIDPDPRSHGTVDELDFISGTTVYVVTLENSRGVYTPLLTTDGGATFAEIGDAREAWGKGGKITYRNETFDGTTGKALVIISGATENGIWRYDADAASPKWTKVQSGGNWSSGFSVGASGIGDGRLLILYDSDAEQIIRTYYPYTMTTTSDWDEISLSMEAPANRAAPGTARSSSGLTLQVTSGGRVQDYTLTSAFQSGISLRSPADGGTVPTNQGDEGITSIFRWQSVADAECYDVQLSLNDDFSATTVDGTSQSSTTTGCPSEPGVTKNASMSMNGITEGTDLVRGENYWWRVRVRATDKSFDNTPPELNQGPWSPVAAFTVSSTSSTVIAPQASLPLHGSQLPGLGTQLSWNNPPGVTQTQVQVTPLNGDGPGINLIFGSPITSYNVPAPVFGEGPYLMLPGATYTWRIRVTHASVAVDESHQSWGPWSEPRTFSTAPPSAGTLALVSPIGGAASSDTTPSLMWKDANSAMFYYEVQLSADPNFGQNGAVAPVYWNLVHGGEADPPNSWTVPDDFALPSGTYHWRVRQRVQATPSASAERGIAWSPTQTFVVN